MNGATKFEICFACNSKWKGIKMSHHWSLCVKKHWIELEWVILLTADFWFHLSKGHFSDSYITTQNNKEVCTHLCWNHMHTQRQEHSLNLSLIGTITCLCPTKGTHLHSQCRSNSTVPLIASKFSMLACPECRLRKRRQELNHYGGSEK